MPQPIRFCFDFISPYAYLAWTQIHALAAKHGREVEPWPVLFAALLDANGQKGPAEIPRKRVYVFKDSLRTASVLGVPLAPPPSHPFNPLLALRVASLPMPENVRRALIDRLFAATWGGGPGVTDPEVVAKIATEAGLDGRAAMADAQRDEAKERVRRQTDAALAAGAFGVPTMLVDEELFWGLDAFGHLERLLRGEDPLPADLAARFGHVAPSATRKGGA